jgi:hypothetical protein
MGYRGWSVCAHPSFLGFTAQVTSPIGRSYPTGRRFPGEKEALAYAQCLIDHLIYCEWQGPPAQPGVAAAG